MIAADGSGERNLAPARSQRGRPTGRRSRSFTPTNGAGEIARIGADGSDRRVLTQTTPEPGRNTIELRQTATGRVLTSFNSERRPSEVALAGSRVALLYAKQLEIRGLNGNLPRQGRCRGSGESLLLRPLGRLPHRPHDPRA